jgi:uncharacterized cofD-like protein
MNGVNRKPAVARDRAPQGDQGFKVVAMGGGTGLSALLQGLKGYVSKAGEPRPAGPFISQLSAVVTVSDDGGSSGKLRKDFNVLAPGDVRNCIVALSEDEALLSRLFQFRFPAGSALSGHSFGNLFLTALSQMTGDFGTAVALSSAVLKTRGTIFPATTANVRLEAIMHDGSRVLGETRINGSKKHIRELYLVPANAAPVPQTLEAIAEADLITIGPGSLFTSLAPNLLVQGIADAISASAALKVFVCNLMTEANESLGLSAAGHIQALYKHAGRPIFDFALINERPVSEETAAKYALEGACQIAIDVAELEALGVTPILGDFLIEGNVARHASARAAAELMRLLAKRRQKVHVQVAANHEQ